MEITISFSSILQIASLIFVAGGIYAWVRYKIQELIEQHKKLEKELEDLEKQYNAIKSSLNDVRHESITREDAFNSFVAKEVMSVHMKNIEQSMAEIKQMISKLEGKRSTD